MENHGSGNSSNDNNNRGRVVYDFEQYTVYQVMALEQLFHECNQNPTESLTLEMISNHSCLSDLGYQQIQVWFEDRRYVKEQKQEGVMIRAVLEKLSEVQILDKGYLQSAVQHMEKEKNFMNTLMEYISYIPNLNAPEMPQQVLRNVKLSTLRRLLVLENDFIRCEVEQLKKENEYMERTGTPSSMLIRGAKFDELMEIVRNLGNLMR